MPKIPQAIYLDHAATTPVDRDVLAAMAPYQGSEFANPSSLYVAARETRLAVEAARAVIANILGAKTTELVFTSGGTEGNNLAVQGILRAHPGAHWVATAIEHDSVLECAKPLRRDGHPVTVIPVRPSGIIATSALESAITDDTVLLSVMLANNEIGTIQPVAEVAKLVTSIRSDRTRRGVSCPLYLHTDAVQAANYLDLHVTRLGVDLLTLNGSKIYGPKGTGALYIRTGTVCEPLFYGGGQERGRRSGTENVSGIVGLAAALKAAASMRDRESRRLAALRDELGAALIAAIPTLMINGDSKRRLPNNLNLTIPGVEGEALVLYLDNAGVLASTGSACSTGSLDPSHVLLAIGRTVAEANSSLRLTLGRSTTAEDIQKVITVLTGVVKRLHEI